MVRFPFSYICHKWSFFDIIAQLFSISDHNDILTFRFAFEKETSLAESKKLLEELRIRHKGEIQVNFVSRVHFHDTSCDWEKLAQLI